MSPARMAKVESAMRVALAFRDAFNRHNVDAMMAILKDDCLFEAHHPAPDGLVINGKDAISSYWHQYFENTSQAILDIEEISGFGERCIMRWKLRWMDSHGNHCSLRGVYIIKTENDLVYEILSYAKGFSPCQ